MVPDSMPDAATTPAPAGVPDAASAKAPALAHHAGRGMSWIVLSSGVGKIASLGAQIALGNLLSAEDFGLFAAATGVASILSVVRDGGAVNILISRGREAYPTSSGPVFWMGLALLMVSAVVMALVAYPIAQGYDKPGMFPLLLLIAASTPLMMPGAVLGAKMRLDLQFATFSKQQGLSAVMRQTLAVALAVLGFKASAMVIPMIATPLWDWAMAYASTRDAPWRRASHIEMWPPMLKASGWMVLGVLGNLLLDWGPYAIMGALLDQAQVGMFYFAFQTTAQLGVFLAYGMQQVLFPVLTQLKDDPERFRQSALRSLDAIMLVGSLACVTLSLGIDPLEKLLWNGKWDGAVLAVMILGGFYVWRVSFGLTTAVMQALGRFRDYAILTWIEGFCLVLATYAGCKFQTHGVSELAVWTGASLFLTRGAGTIYVMRLIGCRYGEILNAIFPAWFLALISGVCVLALENKLGVRALILAPLERFARPGEMIGYALEAGLLCGVGAVVYLLLVRVLIPGPLKDAVTVAPARLRAPAARLLRIAL